MDILATMRFAFLPKKKNSTYERAMGKLNELRDKLNNLQIDFPDFESYELPIIQNEWSKFPKDIAIGVMSMGLHIANDYRSLLFFFEKGGRMKAHYHSREYEIIKVLEGSITCTVTQKTYDKNDVFFIRKNQLHQLTAKSEECYLYVVFTENKSQMCIEDDEAKSAWDIIDKSRKPR